LFFEDPIKLRQRLKTNCESDLTHTQIALEQERGRLLVAPLRHIFHKVGSGGFFELFTEIIRAGISRLRHFAERQLVPGVFVNEIKRFPNSSGLNSVTLVFESIVSSLPHFDL
jgi:hypothetical protein